MARGALRVLRDHPGFRTLCFARVVSFVGDSLSLVALMLYVADETGQALAVSLVLLAGDFAPSLLSPVTGAISDRFDRRRVMIACELTQGGLLALIALTLPPLPLLLALVAARAIAGQVFQPASRAAVPALVPARDLAAANSALGFGTNGVDAAGPLLAAALLPFAGVRGVLLVDAASFLISAAVLTRLPRMPPVPAGSNARPSLFADARSGLAYLLSTPAVRVIALGFWAVVAFSAIDDVALVLLTTETFNASDSVVAVVLAAIGIGLLCGYAVLARYGPRVSTALLLVLGFGVSSLGNLLTGVAWAVAAAFAMQLVRGFGIAATDVAVNTLLQRLVPPGMLGRAFGNLYGGIGVAAAVSYVGGGLLLDATSAPVTFLVIGTGGVLTTVAVALALPRALRRTADR